MAVTPELLSEAVGNDRWRFFLYDVTIEADSKEDADNIILEAKKMIDDAEELREGVWHYPEIGKRISAQTKEDADKRAVNVFMIEKGLLYQPEPVDAENEDAPVESRKTVRK